MSARPGAGLSAWYNLTDSRYWGCLALGFLKKIWLPFLTLLGIGLAIAVPLFLEVFTDDLSSSDKIVITVLQAILAAIGASIVLILAYIFIAAGIPKFLKAVRVWITLKTVRKAVESQTGTVQISGITPIENNVGIGLSVGLQDGVFPGQRFVVLNTANQEKWGVLEVSEVWDRYCVCSVSDRTNPEFWDNLDSRIRSDAAPPGGVTIRREIPEEALYDWLQRILKSWRG